MTEPNFISVAIGTVVVVEDYGLVSAADAFKQIQRIHKLVEIGAISLGIDRSLQMLLDEAFASKQPLAPTTDNELLFAKNNGVVVMNIRKDMGALNLVVSLATTLGIPCFAVMDFSARSADNMLKLAVSKLYELHGSHGHIVHVCPPKQAEMILAHL